MKELTTPNKVRELQRKLYLKSKAEKDYRFYSLYDKVCRWDVLYEAWRQVKANKGACGVDEETIAEVERSGVESFINQLQQELENKTYRPQAVRRIWIPKPDGSKRPLGIPPIRDRVVQSATKMVIDPIFEADFQDCSFGFRPKRSAQQAVKEVYKFLNWGLVNVIDADISDFFNRISHRKLMEVIARRIADGQILWLIHQWIRCRILEEGEIRHQVTGTPQGGVISPLLANIYLNVLDKNWRRKGYSSGKGHNSHLIRYADDLVILTNKNPEQSFLALEKELGEIGLELNHRKTKIISANEKSFDFLGFNFRRVIHREKKKRISLYFPSKKAQESIRATVREITRKRPVKLTDVIQELNPVVRGWVNYFRIGNSTRAFEQIQYYTMRKVRRFIRKQQVKCGYGWKEIPNEFLYGTMGLFSNYRVVHS